MERYLIMNTDDFGQCTSVNEAIFELLSENKVSSATIMPVTPGFEEAAQWCVKNKINNVGLHLTFTSEWDRMKSVSLTGGKSLENTDGYLYKDCVSFNANAKEEEVRAEIDAQFQKVINTGLNLSHVDNHMGSLYGLHGGPSYIPMVFEHCAKYGKLPFRLFKKIYKKDDLMKDIYSPQLEESIKAVVTYGEKLGIAMPDYLLAHPYHYEEGENYDGFKKMIIEKIYDLPEGISETYIHPSKETEEIKYINRSWQKRVWEYDLMKDDDYWYALKDANVKLITYRDLIKK